MPVNWEFLVIVSKNANFARKNDTIRVISKAKILVSKYGTLTYYRLYVLKYKSKYLLNIKKFYIFLRNETRFDWVTNKIISFFLLYKDDCLSIFYWNIRECGIRMKWVWNGYETNLTNVKRRETNVKRMQNNVHNSRSGLSLKKRFNSFTGQHVFFTFNAKLIMKMSLLFLFFCSMSNFWGIRIVMWYYYNVGEKNILKV